MDDFERRRELRRQKREEMRLEAERLAYQRNDDDEEEAARERRRRARQERLRQREEEDSSSQGTEKTAEVNAQNSVADEEAKTAPSPSTTDGGDDAAFLERLARREERRQKRLQEALERQKEFDPTVTDDGLSVPSGRQANDTGKDEAAGDEDKAETRRARYEIQETETVTKSYQRNEWRETQDGQREKDKEEEEQQQEEEEEKPKQRILEGNQVEVTIGRKTVETREETAVVELKNGQVGVEESKLGKEEEAEEATEVVDHEGVEADAEKQRLEAEERERARAEQEKRAAAERERIEAEENERAAEERERREAEAREKREAEARERREAEERERREAEEEKRVAEERKRAEAEKRAAEEKARLEEQKLKEEQEKQVKGKREERQVNEKKVQEDTLQSVVLKKQGEERGIKVETKREKAQEDRPAFRKEEITAEKTNKDQGPREDIKSSWDRKKGFPETKSQNGERVQEFTTHRLKHTESTFSRGKAGADTEEAESQVEAGRRLEELRRRRGETESEEFEKLKQKQQEAAVELEELKKKREERRKVLEEEEHRRKQEEAERKIREEEEKRRLKEEIERRRAEAAEKRQKMPEDGVSDDKKPFKCFTPKGSSLKIEERTEFLNKSAQKSGVKSTHPTAVVSKIDSGWELYTNAIEGTKTTKSTKPAASDLPVPAEGVRNIKSMWEKGNVFASPTGTGSSNKETAGLKVGVSSRINEWLTKTPEGNKSPAPKPSDLRPVDVSNKRNLWEKQSSEKTTSPMKVSSVGKKSETMVSKAVVSNGVGADWDSENTIANRHGFKPARES
ncbi:LOW QUALITY PROTEIN: caldesmon [Ornithorhynchus anatinus]|uniref:LOW QUALITY PROTEIN: caldesmon n=1 Tax=Ornithorhynchus anatinus TaxID=9258 RepID=UPI0010A7E83F|nr:LOW QUALITY PROTEIN: caldesmon [Ornithorhynchus anatinus]